jgi:hypothetical protein
MCLPGHRQEHPMSSTKVLILIGNWTLFICQKYWGCRVTESESFVLITITCDSTRRCRRYCALHLCSLWYVSLEQGIGAS